MTDNQKIDPQALKAIASSSPELAEIVRQYVDRQLNPPLPKRNIDFSAMPPLPALAKFDPDEGAGAGKWIDTYVNYAMSVSPMTPRLFHESAALWLISVAIARRLVLVMPFDAIFTNLYVVWLALTTLYRKSTALNVARKICREVFPFLMASQDTTPEAFLADMAGQQPINFGSLPLFEQQNWEKERRYSAQRGLVLDELSGLLAGAGKDYNAGLLESLLRFFDCDPLYTRSTVGRGRVVVKNSYLSLLGASTPAAMAQHFTAERLWANGWWPRFAILTPEGRPEYKKATAAEPPDSIKAALIHLFNKLPNGHKWPDLPEPLSVTLGDGVYDTWETYNQALSYDLITDDLPRQLHGTYGRLPTQALKVAMILAAIDWHQGQAPKIELPHLIRAMTITETWRASAHRAIAIANETDFNRISERILRIISKCEPDGASLREICRAMKDKNPTEIQMAVDSLLTTEMLEEVNTGGDGKRGRPTVRFVLVKE